MRRRDFIRLLGGAAVDVCIDCVQFLARGGRAGSEHQPEWSLAAIAASRVGSLTERRSALPRRRGRSPTSSADPVAGLLILRAHHKLLTLTVAS